MKYATSELAKSASQALSTLYAKFKNHQGVGLMMYIISFILLLCSQYCLIVQPFGV